MRSCRLQTQLRLADRAPNSIARLPRNFALERRSTRPLGFYRKFLLHA